MAKIVEHQMKFSVVSMTPTWAQELLDKNHPKNRTPKKNRIEQYARDMVQGYWLLTPEPVCVDVDGWLTNGQNRLSAVIRAGVDVPMSLITGCPKRSIGAQDQGAVRNVLDVARISGSPITSGNNVVAAARAMYYGVRNMGRSMSNFEVLEFIKVHRQALDFAFECLPVASNTRGIAQSPVRAVVARAYYRRNSRNRTRQFCEVLVSGLPERTGPDSGAIRLRNWLIDNFLGTRTNKQKAAGARRWIVYAKAARALEAFHAEEEITRIVEKSEELFPMPNEDDMEVELSDANAQLTHV